MGLFEDRIGDLDDAPEWLDTGDPRAAASPSRQPADLGDVTGGARHHRGADGRRRGCARGGRSRARCLRGGTVAQALADALSDPAETVRRTAAEALADKNDPASAPLLVGLIAHQDAQRPRDGAEGPGRVARADGACTSAGGACRSRRRGAQECSERARLAACTRGDTRPRHRSARSRSRCAPRRRRGAWLRQCRCQRPSGLGKRAGRCGLAGARERRERARQIRRGAGRHRAHRRDGGRDLAGTRQGGGEASANCAILRRSPRSARRSIIQSATCARRRPRRWARSATRMRCPISPPMPTIPTLTCASSTAGRWRR